MFFVPNGGELPEKVAGFVEVDIRPGCCPYLMARMTMMTVEYLFKARTRRRCKRRTLAFPPAPMKTAVAIEFKAVTLEWAAFRKN